MTSVQALGLQPRLAPNVRAVHGHYAGTVAQRVDDLRRHRQVGYKNICRLLLGEATPEKLKGVD